MGKSVMIVLVDCGFIRDGGHEGNSGDGVYVRFGCCGKYSDNGDSFYGGYGGGVGDMRGMLVTVLMVDLVVVGGV